MTLAGLFTVGLLGLFALGMLWLFGLGLKNVWRGLESRNWPVADAVVARVEMTSSTTRDTDTRRRSTTYHADLGFRYTVGGTEHVTDQVRWGQTLGSGDPAEAVVLALRYPEGRKVTVHYDPAKPSDAVVRPGLTGTAFLLPGAALAFLLFLVPGCFMVWRLFLGAGADTVHPAPNMTPMIRAFLVIPILMGAAMLFHGARNLLLARQSMEWPSGPGSWIRDIPTNEVPGIEAVREHRGFDYVYRYQTSEGPGFQCIRWFGQGTASGNDSDSEIAREFPYGQALVVRRHPTDPDVAVLSPGIRPFAWILPGGGLGFIVFGLVGILAMGGRSESAMAAKPPARRSASSSASR